MYNEEEEEFEKFYTFPDEAKSKKEMEQEAKAKFIEIAYKAYDLLVTRGMATIDLSEKSHAIVAIRRILGLMVEEEEFERCYFLKKFLSEKLMAIETEPIFDFNRQ